MPQTSSTNSANSWLSLLRASDQKELGASIQRLARLAAAAHRQAEAQRLADAPAPTHPEVEQ